MHLTNYAINKYSDGFVQNDAEDDDCGTKRTLSTILQYLKENQPECDTDELMDQIEDIVVKSCIAV